MVLLVMACRSVGTLGRDGTRWLWIFAVFGVWALGPSLSIGGLDTGVLLPQTLARYVPVVANARIPGRAFVMVQLAGAMIVALLIARREWSTGLAAVLTAAVVCESLALPYPLYRLPARDAIDVRLSRGTGAVIELPSGVRDGFGEYRPVRLAGARASDDPRTAAGRRLRGTGATAYRGAVSRHPGDRLDVRSLGRSGIP